MSDHEQRQEIVRVGKMLHDKSFIAAGDGNISVRVDNYTILSTPTCMSKGMMTAEDLVTVDLSGRKTAGFREVSSEIAMHLMIYRVRPDVNAIVHAHPPTATGFAAAGIALDAPLVSEVVLTLGTVPLAQYATPGTSELVDALEPLVPGHNAILMANHGVVAYGADLMLAYMHMETVEHFARIMLVTNQLGQSRPLTDEQVARLKEIRQRNEAHRAQQTRA
jgi:L-fuculose-phosphate aldolase